MPLNEAMDWGQVGAIDTGGGTVADAFQLAFGLPAKTVGAIGNPSFRPL